MGRCFRSRPQTPSRSRWSGNCAPGRTRIPEERLQKTKKSASKSWALPSDTLDYIDELCRTVQPEHIVEFGSGQSTLRFAGYCRRAGNCSVTSFEHDPSFRNELVKKLSDEGMGDVATVKLAPLVMRKMGDRLLPVYHITDDTSEPAQIILIDGPPSKLGGREGTLYLAMNWAEAGTVVLLDDAERDNESRSVKSWEDEFGDVIQVSHPEGLSRGIASIVVKRPVRTSEIWQHRIARAIDEITSIIPPGSSFILADDDAWNAGSNVQGRRRFYLADSDGVYNGPPLNSSAAIRELEEHRDKGAEFLAIGWPAFWWLESYSELARYLQKKGDQVFESARVMIFRLN